MKRLLIAAIVSVAGHGALVAEETPDFSEGFRRLADLGMPPLGNSAVWARVIDPDMMEYRIQAYFKSAKGNGWVIAGADGGTRMLVAGGLEPVEAENPSKKPSAQDLAKDIEAVIASLTKAAAKMDHDDPFMSRHNTEGCEALLLLAAQLHQNGQTALANRLALATFSLYPDRDTAVDAAVDAIAADFYQKAVKSFFASGDWPAFHKEAASLVERFPRGWAAAGGVRMMLPQLARQAAGESAPDPSIGGATLNPASLEILREWSKPKAPGKEGADEDDIPADVPANVRRQILMMRAMGRGDYEGVSVPGPLWLLETPDEDGSGGPPDALHRMAALGMDAIPALAAIVDDPFFTHLPNPESSRSYYSSDESEEDRALRAYQSMARPATRGDLATAMLANTLPDPDDDLDEQEPAAIRELALAFWNEHRNATREELAAVFLKEGSSEQATQAAEILAGSKDPKAHALFESDVLAADPAIARFQAVRTYLKARRAAGKPFYDQYAKRVREQTPEGAAEDPGNSVEWMIQREGGPEKILKQLASLVEGESPRAQAVRIAKGEPAEAAAAIRGLLESTDGDSFTKRLYALMEGANAATHEETRAQFLSGVFQIGSDSAGEGDEDKDSPDERKIPEAEAKVWRKLIADTRPLPASFQRFAANLGTDHGTMGALAAAAFEYAASGGGDFQAVLRSAPLTGKPAGELVMSRAAARLDGKPLEPLPDPEKVNKERLAAIVAEAGGKPVAEVHTYLKTLTPDERAAWLQWLDEPEDPPMPPTLAELRRIVISRSMTSPYGTADDPAACGIGTGFRLSAESLEREIQALAANVEKHSRALVLLRPADFGPGLQVSATILPMPEKKSDEDDDDFDVNRPMDASRVFSNVGRAFETDPAATAVIVTGLRAAGGSATSNWFVKDGKAVLQAGDEGEEGDFAAVMKSLDDTSGDGPIFLNIQVITRADAEKLNTSNE